SFLLPLFAYLADESRSWETPNDPDPRSFDWWKNDDWFETCMPLAGKRRTTKRSLRVGERDGEKRPAAVRALILYPMDALVEDQLRRMRRALDSEAARAWFQDRRQGNRIYFGRYNGQTPVPGHEFNRPNKKGVQSPDTDRILRLKRALQEAEAAAKAA